MTSIDASTFVNLIASGLVGFFFGAISIWLTHHYQGKRDEIIWQREKDKLHEQFRHDNEMLTVQFRQRENELEQQLMQLQSSQLREKLIAGLDNPSEAIKNIEYSKKIRSKIDTLHPPE